eukprot:CAMPEP_0182552176 /NCGR_PEP_ID=MMETSP1323-20130603/47481_1 /TAXON_ID=236787 /ORGANISM="Florenciella parvula, Strain RCC1693" /LENGTH=36 /DNA_ID= /DNA_START= /DNA_END= /DNA_ORIENTATION=
MGRWAAPAAEVTTAATVPATGKSAAIAACAHAVPRG